MKSIRTGKRQCGVLPVRFSPAGEVEVLLITSRETRRWVMPKGWPMKGRTAAEAAEIEAYEEAGVRGRTAKKRIGAYHYRKTELSGGARDLKVDVFLMHVQQELLDWPERRERERTWFSAEVAANLVAEDGLARLIRRLPRLITLEGNQHKGCDGAEV